MTINNYDSDWERDAVKVTYTYPTITGIGPAERALKAAKISDFAGDVHQTVNDLTGLLLKKHKDYGPKNISQSPGGALNGLRVRMHDKMARINHLIDNGATPENESLEDSFADLANYAIIALLVQKGKWPTE